MVLGSSGHRRQLGPTEEDMRRLVNHILPIALFLGIVASCATPPPASEPEALAEYRETNDPLEPTNRVFYASITSWIRSSYGRSPRAIERLFPARFGMACTTS